MDSTPGARTAAETDVFGLLVPVGVDRKRLSGAKQDVADRHRTGKQSLRSGETDALQGTVRR
jgi:hypothetical protein